MPTLTFGKYKDWTLDSVPGDYLEWILREGIDRPCWLPQTRPRPTGRPDLTPK